MTSISIDKNDANAEQVDAELRAFFEQNNIKDVKFDIGSGFKKLSAQGLRAELLRSIKATGEGRSSDTVKFLSATTKVRPKT